MFRCTTFASLLLFSAPSFADLTTELSQLIGYTILDTKTIEGWQDDEGRGDEFEGCEYGREIIFLNNESLTCSGYGYEYAYRPRAVIIGKELSHKGKTYYDYKMIVGDNVYDMR